MDPAMVAAVFPHMVKAMASAAERVVGTVVQELLAKFDDADLQDRLSAQAQAAFEDHI